MINCQPPMRLRISFTKKEPMRYTSHLDVQRTLERWFRRAQLPLAYTQGFTPRPRMQLAAALPLGFTSECELVDVWLEEDLPLEEIKASLDSTAPPGLMVQHLAKPPDDEPALQRTIESAEYLVTLLEPVADLEQRLERLLTAEHLPRTRRGKSYDLRPRIIRAETVSPDEQGHQRLHLWLTAREGNTGRPEEVLAELGIPFHRSRIHRTQLHFAR
jgi:radical SAM-linked protein